MAANCAARRTLINVASSSMRTKLAGSCLSPSLSSPFPFASKATKLNGITSLKPSSPQKLFLFSRLPKELAGLELSFKPLHSVTASALFTSLLSLHNSNWGCLSEDKATLMSKILGAFFLMCLLLRKVTVVPRRI